VVTTTQVTLYKAAEAKVPVGFAEIGSRIPARSKPLGACEGGSWYEVSGGAYLCSGDGVTLEPRGFTGEVLNAEDRLRVARLDHVNPFRHVKAKRSAPLMRRAPRPNELGDIARDRIDRGLLLKHLEGTYLLSIIRPVTIGGEPLLETRARNYLRVRDVDKELPDPIMHGVKLGSGHKLPLGFASQGTELFCDQGGDLVKCGEVQKHALLPSGHVVSREGRRFVRIRQGLVPRDDVRILRKIERPAGVGAYEKWVHIDLGEQALVAYRGDRPVLATLVSTGKPGHDTPDGLFQVWAKYTAKIMRGVDDDGPYSVQEVPWTMYFHNAYAVHGAYWHDVFGHTRSHGCVNVPPADARWLFYWSEPTLPAGWTGRINVHGMHVYVTGTTPPDTPTVATEQAAVTGP
jgi:hypothetical protein